MTKNPFVKNMKRQRGATLIETSIVIGIIALISIVAIVSYNNYTEGRRVQQATNNLGSMVGGIRNAFGAQGHYEGVSNTHVIKAGFLPAEYHNEESEIYHPWNRGAVSVAPITGGTPHEFTVTYATVPENACINLATTTIGNAVQLQIGGSQVTNVGAITTACDGESNTLAWTFN